MGKGTLLPQPTADTRGFWEGCKERKLLFQQCEACGHVRWPPSILCPVCHSFETRWIEASGKGRIHTFVVYRVAFHPAWKGKVPYITAVVELEEGVRLPTNIVDVPPEGLSCDMPVEVVWEETGEGFFVPRFRPVG